MPKRCRPENTGMSGLSLGGLSPAGQVAMALPDLTFLRASAQGENSSSDMNKEAESAWEKATSQAEEDLKVAEEAAQRQAEAWTKKETAKEKAKREKKEARERARREAEEARAKKETATAAKQKATGDVENTESNEKEPPQEAVETGNELPVQITPEDRPTGETEAPLPAAKPVSPDLQGGTVKLVVAPPVHISQIKKLEQDLQQTPGIRLLLTGGMMDTATIVISLEKPIPLTDILKEMPGVEQVVKRGPIINITLK